jgi:hypothetical protein
MAPLKTPVLELFRKIVRKIIAGNKTFLVFFYKLVETFFTPINIYRVIHYMYAEKYLDIYVTWQLLVSEIQFNKSCNV